MGAWEVASCEATVGPLRLLPVEGGGHRSGGCL